MKTLVTAFACAALAAGSMITAPAAFAQPAFAQTASGQAVVTTTTHTYHYSYGYTHRAYAYRSHAAYRPCGAGYGCGAYLTGRSETGEAIDMDYQAPIGEPVYANGDVAVICSCDHRR